MKLKTFLTIFAFFLYSEASFAQGMEGHVDPTAGQGPQGGAAAAAPSQAAQSSSSFRSCDEADANIQKKCTANPTLQGAIANQTSIAQVSNGATTNGSAANQEQVLQTAKPTRSAYQSILATCQEAASSCQSVCRQENRSAQRQNPPDTREITVTNQTMQLCEKEKQTVTAEATARIMDLDQIIKAASAALELLKGLKGGSGSDVALSDSDDPCEKYNGTGILVGQCGNETGSTASRATGGLTGVGAAGLDSSGDGLIQTASMDEAGGSGLGNKSGSGAFNPNSSGGMSGFGFGGGVGSGTAAGTAGEEGLDTDIHKGFISADGGGGGFSSGGGSKASVRPFGRGTSDDSGGGTLQKAALNRKLSRYANSEKRGLASTGDKNGPFQDNWTIIKKAYKKNSNTMFHQK